MSTKTVAEPGILVRPSDDGRRSKIRKSAAMAVLGLTAVSGVLAVGANSTRTAPAPVTARSEPANSPHPLHAPDVVGGCLADIECYGESQLLPNGPARAPEPVVPMNMGLIAGVASPASATEVLRLSLTAHAAEPPVFDPVTSTLTLHLVGSGSSNILGAFTVDTRVTQRVQEGCTTASSQNAFTAADGELFVSGEDRVCPDGRGGSIIIGRWTITGGTDAYTGVTGQGVRFGTFSGGISSFTWVGILDR